MDLSIWIWNVFLNNFSSVVTTFLSFVQVCKQLYALADLGPEDWVDLSTMRSAMGVMQHHDAITGTEKEHVAHDYARLLSEGFSQCQIITKSALK